MKVFVILFAFSLLAVQSAPVRKMSDREHAGFIGPVKSVNIEYEITDQNYGDRLAGKHCRGLTEVYNESGQLIQRSSYPGSCGENEIRDSYSYSPEGSRITTSREVSGKTAPPPPAPDTVPAKETFRYDDADLPSESSLVNSNGQLITKFVYQYDSMRRLIEVRTEGASGDVFASRMYKYDGNNKVPAGSSNTDFVGLMHETTTYSEYKFNAQGDWIKRKVKTEQTLARSQTLVETRTIEYWAKSGFQMRRFSHRVN